jgi:phosphohistidine phosphatase
MRIHSMKQLLIIRHGKSAWDLPGLNDHDRTLNSRGEHDAPRIAAALKQRGVIPGAVMTSTAVRAESTAKLVAEGLEFSVSQIITNEALYLASPRTIINVVQQCDESVETLLVFGHNPGMHDATDLISNAACVDHFPTLAVARFELQVDHWGECDARTGLLLDSFSPKTLQNG